MGGVSQLKSKIKKLSRSSLDVLEGSKRSIVYIDTDDNILWDDNVVYNDGVLAVPLPMSIDEWESWD